MIVRRSTKEKKKRRKKEHGEGELPSVMPVPPWTGLNALLQDDSVIEWEDFEFLVACTLTRGEAGHALVLRHGPNLGRRVRAVADLLGVDWDAGQAIPPPCSRAVGRVLAQAVNGMIEPGGCDADVSQPGCALRRRRNGCLRLKPHLLPAAWNCPVSGATYKYLVLARFCNGQFPMQPMRIAAHRLVCYLANGQPGANQECMHTCDNPWCCSPGHLLWGTRAENNAQAREKRSPRK